MTSKEEYKDHLTEERVEITGEERQKLLLMVHGQILVELLQHERFQLFLAGNYSIEPKIDHEGQSVGFTVREFTQEEVSKMMREALKEAQSQLVVASEADLKNLDRITKVK